MPLDRDRLVKVLSLTTSDVEGEALAALRRANEIIKGAGMSWDDVIASQAAVNLTIGVRQNPHSGPFGMSSEDFKQEGGEWSPPHLRDKVMIPTMFRAIYAQPADEADEGFWRWLDNVHQSWLDHGQLSVKQYQGVRRSYNRVVRKAAAG